MRGNIPNTDSRVSDATYWAVITLSLLSFGELVWAFIEAGASGLTSQQTTISDLFFDILAGSLGFFFGGIAVSVNGRLPPGMKLSIRAIGGSALFLVALYRPLFVASAWEPVPNGITNPAANQVEITSPSTNSVVGHTVEIRGRTAHPNWRHFILVTGPAQGSEVIQDGEVTVSSSGQILGRATLGSAAVGAGESYTIRVVASEKALTRGPFIRRNGLLLSNAITVTRSPETERS